jgi:hypothetical protein
MKFAVVPCLVFGLLACGGEGSTGAGSSKSSSSAAKKDEKKDEKFASCASEKLKNCRQYSGMNLAAGTDSLKGLCDRGLPYLQGDRQLRYEDAQRLLLRRRRGLGEQREVLQRGRAYLGEEVSDPRLFEP